MIELLNRLNFSRINTKKNYTSNLILINIIQSKNNFLLNRAYLIKGSLPLYKPPKVTESKIKNRLEPIDAKKKSSVVGFKGTVPIIVTENKLNKSNSLREIPADKSSRSNLYDNNI